MMTGVGVLLGTAAYMSPEQARGKAVDKRSDIWAFGCVLYEMLTRQAGVRGRRCRGHPRQGPRRSQPDWLALGAALPLRVRELLHRCLEKDARRRLREIGDELADLQDASPPEWKYRATGSTPDPSVRWWRVAAAGLTILSLGLAAGGVGVSAITEQRDVGVLRFDITAPGTQTLSGLGGDLAISPRGRDIAFGGLGVHVRSLDRLEVRSLAGPGQSAAVHVAGRRVGGVSRGYYAEESEGHRRAGPHHRVRRRDSSRRSELGNRRYHRLHHEQRQWTVSGFGHRRRATRLTSVSARDGEVDHRWPEMLPSGRAVLFTISRGGSGAEGVQIAVLDLDVR